MYLHTFSGKIINLEQIREDDIDIVDIAHALSNLCRFGGHTKQFYSVAQHSLRVANLVPEEFKLEALLHDATEAYIGDVVRPLKKKLTEYISLEYDITYVIQTKFGLPTFLSPVVREADTYMLHIEAEELMTVPLVKGLFCENSLTPITPPVDKAKKLFLQALKEYSA